MKIFLNNFFLQYPLVKEERKTFFICCLLCCCETDPLFINARIPVGGYTPGQTIELLLEINNKSDQTFQNFEIQIIKVTYSCTKYVKLCLNTVVCQ